MSARSTAMRDPNKTAQAGLEYVPGPSPYSTAPIPYHQENAAPYPHQTKLDETLVAVDAHRHQASGAEKKRILGLTVPVFWGIAIALILVLAGAIGAGVGAGLAAQKSNSSQTSTLPSPSFPASSPSQSISSQPGGSSTASSTTTAPTGGVSPVAVDGGCPRINGTTFTPLGPDGAQIVAFAGRQPQSFTQLCYTNYPSGPAYGNPGTTDLLRFYTRTLEDCITACASWNQAYPNSRLTDGSRGMCRSVALVKTPGEYCYLKNATGTNDTFGAPGQFVSAVLLPGSI